MLRETWSPNLEGENRKWLVNFSFFPPTASERERLFQFVNTIWLTGGMLSPGCGKFYRRVNKKQSTQRKVVQFSTDKIECHPALSSLFPNQIGQNCYRALDISVSGGTYKKLWRCKLWVWRASGLSPVKNAVLYNNAGAVGVARPWKKKRQGSWVLSLALPQSCFGKW